MEGWGLDDKPELQNFVFSLRFTTSFRRILSSQNWQYLKSQKSQSFNMCVHSLIGICFQIMSTF